MKQNRSSSIRVEEIRKKFKLKDCTKSAKPNDAVLTAKDRKNQIQSSFKKKFKKKREKANIISKFSGEFGDKKPNSCHESSGGNKVSEVLGKTALATQDKLPNIGQNTAKFKKKFKQKEKKQASVISSEFSNQLNVKKLDKSHQQAGTSDKKSIIRGTLAGKQDKPDLDKLKIKKKLKKERTKAHRLNSNNLNNDLNNTAKDGARQNTNGNNKSQVNKKPAFLNIKNNENTQDKAHSVIQNRLTNSSQDKSKAVMPVFDGAANWKQLIQSKKVIYRGKSNQQKGNQGCKVNQETEKKKKQIDAVPPKPDIWFDDVDEILLDKDHIASSHRSGSLTFKDKQMTHPRDCGNQPSVDIRSSLVRENSFDGVTKAVAMDCEMVGVGWDGKDNMLARVSLVNQYGHCIYNKYCRPTEKVTDYRTAVSGIRPEHLNSENALEFSAIQKEVSDLIDGKILVGHALHNDLRVLYLDHPRKMIRDTSRYKPFRVLFSGGIPSLKKLTDKVLGVKVQEGEHCSIQDAQAAMRLYTLNKTKWERALKLKRMGLKLKDKNDKTSNLSKVTTISKTKFNRKDKFSKNNCE